jgi:hypothetical protein
MTCTQCLGLMIRDMIEAKIMQLLDDDGAGETGETIKIAGV